MNNYAKLEDLLVYRLAVELSDLGWNIFKKLSWHEQKIIGDQFIRADDSVGANIAEGYGRFHYLDRIKFYYNSRGSLLEVKHWCLLLKKRSMINEEEFNNFMSKVDFIHYQLNIFIKSCYQSKDNQ